jgi:prepilin-type N-terminal cleavage/methylation domain-containing protein
MNKIKSGFTLIEILIVIAIIGVLSVSLVPNIAGAPARARDLAKKQAVTQANAAMQAFVVLNGKAVHLGAADGAFPANPVAVCLNDIEEKWQNRIFDGEIPSTDTQDTDATCYDADDKKLYPNFTINEDGDYKFSIAVEASSSATNDASDAFELGSTDPVIGDA